MSTQAKAIPSTSITPATDEAAFDWWAVLVGVWILTGVYLDTWARTHFDRIHL